MSHCGLERIPSRTGREAKYSTTALINGLLSTWKEALTHQHVCYESEHNHKQDFRAKTHDSPFSQALVVGNGGCYTVRLLIVFVFHG
jgi:hypothetical protein